MHRVLVVTLSCAVLLNAAKAASKPHVIAFGKWTSIEWLVGADEKQAVDLKVRPLFVDGRVKEFTFGAPHDITDRLFVVRRIIRVNDLLPQEPPATPRWSWQPGGWLLVDRVSAHISLVSLPEFDPYYSSASWFRDYIAYCGLSEEGKKLYAVVMQLGRRKPILKKALSDASASDKPDAACPPPAWQRQPTRVTFAFKADQSFTYSVRGHAVEVVAQDEEDKDDETE